MSSLLYFVAKFALRLFFGDCADFTPVARMTLSRDNGLSALAERAAPDREGCDPGYKNAEPTLWIGSQA
jgi:hypothetical protein